MSDQGVPVSPQDQQPQQPLFGDPAQSMAMLQFRRMLAEQMMQQGNGNGGPVGSRWEAINRAVSPLVGFLAQRHIIGQQQAMQDAATPEIAKIMQGDNPIAGLAASQNPLVRAYVSELMPAFLKNYEDTQGAVSKAKALGPVETANEVAKANALIPSTVAAYNAQTPGIVSRETSTAKALAPIKINEAVGTAAGVSHATLADKLKSIAAAKGGAVAPTTPFDNPGQY